MTHYRICDSIDVVHPRLGRVVGRVVGVGTDGRISVRLDEPAAGYSAGVTLAIDPGDLSTDDGLGRLDRVDDAIATLARAVNLLVPQHLRLSGEFRAVYDLIPKTPNPDAGRRAGDVIAEHNTRYKVAREVEGIIGNNAAPLEPDDTPGDGDVDTYDAYEAIVDAEVADIGHAYDFDTVRVDHVSQVGVCTRPGNHPAHMVRYEYAGMTNDIPCPGDASEITITSDGPFPQEFGPVGRVAVHHADGSPKSTDEILNDAARINGDHQGVGESGDDFLARITRESMAAGWDEARQQIGHYISQAGQSYLAHQIGQMPNPHRGA